MIAWVVIALVVAALAGIGALWVGRRAGRPSSCGARVGSGSAPAWPAALAVGVPAPIAYIIAFGWPGFPPTDSLTRTVWMLALIAAGAAVVSSRARLHHGRWLLLAAPLGVVAPQAFHEWTLVRSASVLLIAALGGAVFAISLDTLERRGRASDAMQVLGSLAGAVGIALSGAASLTLSAVTMALVIPSVGAAIVAVRRPGTMTGVVAHAAVGAVLACVLAAAWSYTADLPIRTLIALPLIPFCAAFAVAADRLVCPFVVAGARPATRLAAAVIPAAMLVAIGHNAIET